MENYGYEKPVSELLHLGKSSLRDNEPEHWIDYVSEYGFTSEHIPELQRLYEDDQFQNSDFWDEPEGMAFVHVLRVLGQLKDETTLPFLFNIVEIEEDSDWVWEQIPYVLAQFGSSILSKIQENLDRLREQGHFLPSSLLLNALNIMGKEYPEIQPEIFDYWLDVLKDYETNDYGLNAELINMFADHKYEPALPLIEQAFKAQRVDEFYSGDYEDTLVDYGLKEADPNRKPKYFSPYLDDLPELRDMLEREPNPSPPSRERKIKKKKKAKRKQAKKSRRKNRKKK